VIGVRVHLSVRGAGAFERAAEARAAAARAAWEAWKGALEGFARAFRTPATDATLERVRAELQALDRAAKEREQRTRARSVPHPALARALFVPRRPRAPAPRRAPWPVALRSFS
jgi:hypothetical protein